MIKFVIRIIWTICLLIVVWMNSHWSVALSITLLAVTQELIGFTLAMFDKTIKDVKRNLYAK